jgi:hypothetical protein
MARSSSGEEDAPYIKFHETLLKTLYVFYLLRLIDFATQF